MNKILVDYIKKHNLKFHIDDAGRDDDVFKQIEAYNHLGSLKSVSVLVTHPGAKKISSYLNQNPNIKVFLHPNLTTGHPVLNHKQIPSLADENGFKYSTLKMALALSLGLIKSNDIEKELSAQLKMAKKLNLKLSGIDGEQHIQAFEPVSSLLIKHFADFPEFSFRSLSSLKAQSIIGKIKLLSLKILAMISTKKFKLPKTWNLAYQKYYMASWEKLNLSTINKSLLIVIHPGTEFDKIDSTLKLDDRPPTNT